MIEFRFSIKEKEVVSNHDTTSFQFVNPSIN
jgi:hypothetical protein